MQTTYVFVATGFKSSPDTKVGISLARRQGGGNNHDVVTLSGISETSIFAGQGLQVGMVVSKINNVPIRTVEEASNIIRYHQGTMTIEVVYNPEAQTNAIEAPAVQYSQPNQQPPQYKYDAEAQSSPQAYATPQPVNQIDGNNDSNKKRNRMIIILIVVLIIVVIGVGVGVAVAVTSSNGSKVEENNLQAGGNNQPPAGGSGFDSPSVDDSTPSVDDPPPTSPGNPPTSPPSGGGGGGGQDIMDLVSGTWFGFANDCILETDDGQVDFGETTMGVWICPTDGVFGISLHGEDANGDPAVSFAFTGSSSVTGDDYVFYDVTLTDADTEEQFDGLGFDIFYREAQGGVGESLLAYFIGGDQCDIVLFREDLSDIATLDEFCQ